jgi:hemoglobin
MGRTPSSTRSVWILAPHVPVSFIVTAPAGTSVPSQAQPARHNGQVDSSLVTIPDVMMAGLLCMKEERMETQNNRSLYERLGGVYNIATVVDDFIDRIMVDARLNANPRVDEAHHRVSPPGFKYLVTEIVCWATGGPQKYTGRSMNDSHYHLLITEQEWLAFMDDFQQTLDKFNVPPREQQELKAIVMSTKPDIVAAAHI